MTVAFPLLLIPMIIGAAATAGSGILARKNAREEAIAQAEQEKKAAQLRLETSLGTMERDLTLQKEADLRRATGIERGAVDSLTTSMQQSYIEQLSAETGHANLMAGMQQELGGATAAQASSGARSDLTIASILQSESARQIGESRKSIDRNLSSSVGAGQMNLAEAKTQAGQIRDQYKAGSAFMDLYDFKRGQVQAGYELEDDWLDRTISENQYQGDWIWMDVFGVGGAAAGAYSSMYSMGAFNSPKFTPYQTDKVASNQFYQGGGLNSYGTGGSQWAVGWRGR